MLHPYFPKLQIIAEEKAEGLLEQEVQMTTGKLFLLDTTNNTLVEVYLPKYVCTAQIGPGMYKTIQNNPKQNKNKRGNSLVGREVTWI